MSPFKCYLCLQPASEFPQDFDKMLTELTAVFYKINSLSSNCTQVTPLALCKSCWSYLMKIHQSDNKLSLLHKVHSNKITCLSAKIRQNQRAPSLPSQSPTVGQPAEEAKSETIVTDFQSEEDDSDEEDWPPEGILVPSNSLVVKRVSKKKFIYRETFSFKGKGSGFQCGLCPLIFKFAAFSKYGKLWSNVVNHIQNWHENVDGVRVGPMQCKQMENCPDMFQYGKFTFEVLGQKLKCCECGFMATQNPLRKFQYITDHILEEHVKIQRKYKCGFCRMLFLSKSNRSIHLKMYHSQHMKKVLAESGRKARKKPTVSSLKVSEITSDDGVWPPNGILIPADTRSVKRVSVKQFTYRGEFQFEGTDFGFKCLSCPFLTKFVTDLVRHPWHNIVDHIKQWHSEGTRQAAKGPGIPRWKPFEISPDRFLYNDIPFKKLEDGQYECEECGFRSNVSHQKAMGKIVQHILHQHLQATKERICEVCGKQFQSQVSLWHHKRMQHELKEEQILPCAVCDKKFKSKMALHKHEKRVHGDGEEKNNICEVCGKRFRTTLGLEGHKFSHTGVREYKCRECGKMFASYPALNVHRHSHTGKKYTCNVCGMDFTQHYSVKRHKRTAHP